MSEKVLFVDDEANVILAITRQLRKKFEVHTGLGGDAGLQVLEEEGPFAVVISDMRMPGMDGIRFLEKVMTRSPDTVRLMLTGNDDQATAVRAINSGCIFSFHTKPCHTLELEQAVKAGIKQHHLITAERALLESTLAGSVKVLLDVLSILDPDAFGKRSMIQERAHKLTKALGLDRSWELNIAVMLSPIGQIALPSEIVTKLQEGKGLSDSEREIVARVPEVGRNLIANIPRLKKVSEIIYYQNKGFDGSGFPDGEVSGNAILQEARILKVLNDLTDAETKEGSIEAAFGVLETYSSLYDPKILDTARSKFLLDASNAPQEPIKETIEIQTYLLREGDRLASDIKTTDGTLLLAAGVEVSQADIERLHNKLEIVSAQPTVRVTRPDEAPGTLWRTRKTEADYVDADHNSD